MTGAKRGGAALLRGAIRAAWHLGRLEHEEGTLGRTLLLLGKHRGPAFARDWTLAELLEWAASRHGSETFLEYGADRYSFAEMNRRANRVARRLRGAGLGEGQGVALMLSNHPRFLDTFFAVQKLGAYAVPVNTALVGEGLSYLLTHSEVCAVVCDHETAPKLAAVRAGLPRVGHLWVNTAEAPEGYLVPDGLRSFEELEGATLADDANPGVRPGPGAPSLLMYTSGTTGLPKAVVSLYGEQRVKATAIVSHLLSDKSDKLYTCLPLFHANALLLTVLQALWIGIPLRLGKRFSASRFWKELAECGATQFNTVGGMIPILLKTPRSPHDRAHRVRRVLSAACPKDAWVPFEQRFGLELWEAYGAVDAAGLTIFNAGTAPIGSLGRPARTLKWRLVDDRGRDAPPGAPGELWVFVADQRESKVRYWKNERASNEKVVDGWLHTGDLMQADPGGYLYFVGRNTDSMRHRGENVSAHEVEAVVDAHPDVLESAAFGVPSPLGEQDVMISVVPVEGRTIEPAELLGFLQERLPRYAVPSYLDVVAELPKTGTHRVMKSELKRQGVTATTFRFEHGHGPQRESQCARSSS
ncbi:MAG: AMP-binding protein [Myxococcaceae bacterium]